MPKVVGMIADRLNILNLRYTFEWHLFIIFAEGLVVVLIYMDALTCVCPSSSGAGSSAAKLCITMEDVCLCTI